MKPLCLIVCDSRGKNFERIFNDYDCFVRKDLFYDVKFIAIRGARVQDLLEPTLSYISGIDHKIPILLKLAAGINNFTKKNKNRYNETEISLNYISPNEVFLQLTNFVEHVKRAHINSVVTICGIPTANLRIIQQHSVKLGRLRHPSVSEDTLKLKTDLLNIDVEIVNQKIAALNKKPQCSIIPYTASLDSYVLKKKSGGKRRYMVQSLPDGLHGSDLVQLNWLNCIWKSLMKEATSLEERGLPIGWDRKYKRH